MVSSGGYDVGTGLRAVGIEGAPIALGTEPTKYTLPWATEPEGAAPLVAGKRTLASRPTVRTSARTSCCPVWSTVRISDSRTVPGPDASRRDQDVSARTGWV